MKEKEKEKDEKRRLGEDAEGPPFRWTLAMNRTALTTT